MSDPRSLGLKNRGLTLYCDAMGRIEKILDDEMGLLGEEAVGRSLIQLVDRGSREKAMHFLASVRSGKSSYDWDLHIQSSQGELVTLFFTGIVYEAGLLFVGIRSKDHLLGLYQDLLRISNEQVNRLRGLLKEKQQIDLPEVDDQDRYDRFSRLNNELTNLQREMSKKNRELEDLNRQKDRFLGMAAHDVRGALTVIDVYSQFVMRELGEQASETVQDYVEKMHQSILFVAQLVDDFLDLSVISSGNLVLNLWPADLAELTERIVSIHRVLAERKGIELSLKPGEGSFTQMVDANKLEQVLSNLINNALKFSPPDTRVSVGIDEFGEGCRIWVEDQGPGIPKDELERLFLPFERTSVKSSAGEKSSGLGLAIAMKIVQGHGGRIDAESTPGEGSRFSVYLPNRDQSSK